MGQNLAKNSLFNISYKGFNVVYPVLTSAYISRIFLADGVGSIMFAINIVTYFTIAASLGIPNYAVKCLAPVRQDQGTLNRRFSELAAFIFSSSIVATLLYYVTAMTVFRGDALGQHMAYALGLMVVTNVFNFDWLFESVEDFRYMAVRSILIKSAALLLMFVVVKSRADILLYCLIYAGITVANNLCNLVSSRRYVRFVWSKLDIRQHVTPVFTLFAAAFATELYILLDSTMLGVMCPPEHLGYYSNASRVVRASFGIIFAAIAVFNPRLNYLYRNGGETAYQQLFQRFYDIGMSIAFPTAALLFVLAPMVTTLLFGAAFAPGILTLRLLAPLIVVFTLACVFGHIALIIYGKERGLLYAALLGAVSNFLLNQWLIPLYAHDGAAVASVISEVLVTVLLMSISLRCCKVVFLDRWVLASMVLSAVILTGGIALIG